MWAKYRLGLGYWRDLFRASDPGLDRLRTGGRAALTVIFSLGLLYFLADWLGHPLISGLPGVVTGMLGVILVNDDTPGAQKLTLALLAIPAVAVFLLGGVLAGDPFLNGIGFVAVILASVILRRFGPRGLALGMVAFLSYIFALFFRAGVEDLPWICTSTLVSLGCAYGVRFGLLREGKRRFVWARRAMFSRINMLLRVLEYAACGEGAPAENWKRARALVVENLEQLNAAALRVEDAWPQHRAEVSKRVRSKDGRSKDGGSKDGGPEHARSDDGTAREDAPEQELLPRWIFAMEMVAERVTVNLRRILTADDDDPAIRRDIVAALQEARPVIDAARRRRASSPTPQLNALIRFAQNSRREPLRRFSVSLQDVTKIAFWSASEVESRLKDADVADPYADHDTPATPNGDAVDAPSKPPMSANTREAVQAVIAGSLAILAGHLISPTRWYWAVIASFVIFIRTGSRGHIMLKGAQRVVGTVLGVAGGLGIVLLVEGHQNLELGLILLALFLGYYLAQVSYAWMITCVTMQIGLLYALMGRPVQQVLIVRFQETLLGVVIGVVVAVLVLPTRTRPKINNHMADLLEECAGFFEASALYMREKSADIFIKQRSRKLTRSLQELREAARPMRGRLALVKRGRVNYKLLLLSVLVYQARNLAASAEPSNADLGAPAREQIAQRAAQLGRTCRGLVRVLRHPEESLFFDPQKFDPQKGVRLDADGDEVGPAAEPFDLPDEPGERLAPHTVAQNALRAGEKIAREFARALDSDGYSRR